MRRARAIALTVLGLLLFTGVILSSVAIWSTAIVAPSTPSVIKDSAAVADVNDHDADDVAGSVVDDEDADNDD